MNKEEIDGILKALIEENQEKYFELVGKILGVEPDKIRDSEAEYTKMIIKEFEKSDCEYLKSLITNSEYTEFIVELFSEFSEDKNKDKYELIEKQKELGLNAGDVRYLIESINDENFTKECIERKEEYGFSSYDISYLTRTLEDKEFIKKIISKSKEYNFDSYSISAMIEKVDDEEFTKECIEKREELSLDGYNIVKLIKKIDDEEFIKEFIKEHIEKREKLGLSGTNIVDLLQLIEDKDFVKKYTLRSEELGIMLYAKELIEFIDEDEFTFEFLKNIHGREYSYKKSEIFFLIKDKEIAKKYILEGNNGYYQLIEKIESIDDKEFTKECVRKAKSLGIHYSDIEDLIDLVNEEEFTKECILNKELELSEFYVGLELQYIEDVDFKKECVLNNEELKLNSETLKKIIITIEEPDFIKECVLKGRTLGIEDLNLVELIQLVNEKEFTKKCVLEQKFELRIVKELIDLVNEKEFTKECILKRVELGLDSKYLINKLKEINESDFVKLVIINREEMELDGELLCEVIKLSDEEMTKKIDFDKLEELLTMKDAEYIKDHLLDTVILKNVGNGNIDINKINEEIEKTYEIFLTNDLPKNFKYFEFFKNHEKNYNSTNSQFYQDNDKEKRDKIITGDLFRTLLESDNIEMKTFLETLYNGNIAINLNNESELSQAILLRYRDVLYELLDVVESNTISKTEDYNKDLEEIRKYLKLEEKEDIGEILLLKYFENIGLNYKKSEEPLIETLLNHMEVKKQIAQKNNSEEFVLEEGDLIKGTQIRFIEDFLKNGIRAKEFLMKGEIMSDATPLDTDFSEITKENLSPIENQDGSFRDRTLSEKLNSTYTGAGYGHTYLVIKKENYENDEISYSQGSLSRKTRYFRTGIGSTNISAIITSEWNDEYKYTLATNGFYIPVIDKETGKVLFTKDEYIKIRENMQGLSHFGTKDFILDDTANNTSIEEQAKELKEKAKGKISTEEKREKVIEKIRKNIGKLISTEMLGDISNRFVELIDTGSTGRGTNIPGDGDFDFMLKCKDKEEQSQMIAKIKTFISGVDKGGTNEFNIRYTGVKIEGLEEEVEVDVTSEKKMLETEYSSDMAVRDRLKSIEEKYGEEGLKTVIDNIIVAKKILKENGVYKKSNSIGGTEFGGFGGIGVENWILQNGGSFVRAMETFLENTVDENGNEVSFEQFKNNYPIYDFGQNHKDLGNSRHDHFVEGLTKEGFDKLKEVCKEQLKLLGEKNKEKDKLGDSIVTFTEEAKDYKFSDLSRVYSLLARFRTHELDKEDNNRGEQE